MKINDIKQQLNHSIKWLSMHKKIVSVILLSGILMFVVLHSVFSFRLKKADIDRPSYVFEAGEVLTIDYDKISKNESPNVITIIEPSAKNQFKKMSIELTTTNIIIEDTLSGDIYETLKVDDTLSQDNQDLQRSPLFLTYMYEGWTTGKRLDALTHSISKQKYTIEIIDEGVRVTYHIAQHTPQLSWMPQRIEDTLFDTLFESTDASGRIALNAVYQRPTGASFYQIVSSIAQPFVDRIYRLWYEEYGLTFDSLFELNAYFNIRNNFIEVPDFKIPVEYTLDQGDFVTRVVLQEIKEDSLSFDEDRTLFLQDIDLLPYFQSTKNHPDAWMFVPDGSGAIIELDRPDFASTRFTKAVYQNKSILSSSYLNYTDEAHIYMPVFGMAKENKGIFGIIESGAYQSEIQIRRASSNNGINAIYPTILYRLKDTYSLSGIDLDMFSAPIIDEVFTLRYRLIAHDMEDVHYMDMVETYQSYLFDESEKTFETPDIHVDFIGAIKERAFFMGIPYDHIESLTSYQESMYMMEALKTYVDSFGYLGWSEGGLEGVPITDLNIENALGSKRDFQRLQTYVNEANVSMMYQTHFIKQFDQSNGFSNRSHGIRLIGDYTRTFYPYDFSTMRMRESAYAGSYYLLDPMYLMSYVQQFMKKDALDLSHLYIDDLPHTMSANLGRNGYALTHIESIYKEALETLGSSYQLTLNRPNFYTVPYATCVMQAPHQSSGLHMFSYDIPFYELVLHGHVPYYLSHTNYQPLKSSQMMFLKALSSGAGLSYALTYESSSVTKTSPYYNFIYATTYDEWKDDIMMYSALLDSFYDIIGSNEIVFHQVLSKHVVLITYDNQTQVIINMQDTPYQHGLFHIDAMDYVILGG